MENELRAALGDDLDALIRLHDREVDAPLLAAMQAAGFPDCLALLPADKAGTAAWAGLGTALANMAQAPPEAILDQLAADFAAVYLNNQIGVSPYESVWLDDDHLTCQQPMFELRRLYAAAGLEVGDRRQRHDDHLVCQLQYLRFMLGRADADWAALAAFIDEHLGYWLPQFAERLAQSGGNDFYAGLARVTCAWLERFRDLLAEIHQVFRPPREAVSARIRRKLALDRAEVAPLRFMPGAQGPSW